MTGVSWEVEPVCHLICKKLTVHPVVVLTKNNGENMSLLLNCVKSAVYVGTIASVV
jgi:hypothetical protein